MVQAGLEGWNLADLDFLFIENVGNLACPSAYDLGEDVRLVLQSVTEGDDKPLKYPTLFHSGDVAILTKMDLAAAVELDWEGATQNRIGPPRHGNSERVRETRSGHGGVPRICPQAPRLLGVLQPRFL